MCTCVLDRCHNHRHRRRRQHIDLSLPHVEYIHNDPHGSQGCHQQPNCEGEVETEPHAVRWRGGVIRTTFLLRPAWEILGVMEEDDGKVEDAEEFYCVFPNKAMSSVRPLVALLSTGQRTFKFEMTASIRPRMPFPQPALTKSLEEGFRAIANPSPELLLLN